MADKNPQIGHRERLRKRFVSNPESFSDSELLQLILTYAIPRRDVAPLAENLFVRFGDITGVFSASYQELCNVDGIGEQAAILLTAIARLSFSELNKEPPVQEQMRPHIIKQAKLFEVEPALGPIFDEPKAPQMRTFTNDEIENSLHFLPKANDFNSLDDYREYLEENLPYNSFTTRKRRTNNILNRFFSDGNIHSPLVYYSSQVSNIEDSKQALFYELLRAEPIASKAAEEFVWPASPVGYVDREGMGDFISKYLTELKISSKKKVVSAIFKTYDLLSVGNSEGNQLRIQIHKGTLESFLYVFSTEYPKPGVYSFDTLFKGPIRHWLLWDKEWIRQQLYNLQDFGIIAKVSEIDTVRQFTTHFDQMTTLRTYFEHPQRGSLSIRERAL